MSPTEQYDRAVSELTSALQEHHIHFSHLPSSNPDTNFPTSSGSTTIAHPKLHFTASKENSLKVALGFGNAVQPTSGSMIAYIPTLCESINDLSDAVYISKIMTDSMIRQVEIHEHADKSWKSKKKMLEFMEGTLQSEVIPNCMDGWTSDNRPLLRLLSPSITIPTEMYVHLPTPSEEATKPHAETVLNSMKSILEKTRGSELVPPNRAIQTGQTDEDKSIYVRRLVNLLSKRHSMAETATYLQIPDPNPSAPSYTSTQAGRRQWGKLIGQK